LIFFVSFFYQEKKESRLRTAGKNKEGDKYAVLNFLLPLRAA